MNHWHLSRAAQVLHRGGVVLHATEGVWGLGCDAFDARAVALLLSLKQRSVDKGLIVIGDRPAAFEPELAALGETQRQRVIACWPGAVTWILPNRRFPDWITGGRDSVAVRVPGHDQARALCAAFGGVLVSTSANRAGLPAPRNGWQARAWLTALQRRGRISRRHPELFVLPGETAGHRGPSEIRTVEGRRLRGGP